MTEYLIIDRIENGIAACEREDRTMRMIPISLLPDGAREGDVVLSRDRRYSIDEAETRRRREYNEKLWEQLKSE